MELMICDSCGCLAPPGAFARTAEKGESDDDCECPECASTGEEGDGFSITEGYWDRDAENYQEF